MVAIKQGGIAGAAIDNINGTIVSIINHYPLVWGKLASASKGYPRY
jgi:hypothetical protein